jgi:hypothetical protein
MPAPRIQKHQEFVDLRVFQLIKKRLPNLGSVAEIAL